MIQKIKQWWQKRKREEERRVFARGFAWAMTDYFVMEKSIEEIEAYIDASKIFSDYSLFDSGAERAIDIIRMYELKSGK